MSKKLKLIVGISLVTISVALMIFWEAEGRALVMNRDVIVAGRDLSAGEVCSGEDLVIRSIPKDAVIKDGVLPDGIQQYLGQKWKHDISENSQISVNSFLSEETEIPEGMSLFRIKKDWILNVSSSIRKGDTVRIYAYGNQAASPLGTYYVAFVKDGSGREVTEITGFEEPRILQRTNGLALPAEVEIAAVLEDYTRILQTVMQGGTLIIEQKEVSLYE